MVRKLGNNRISVEGMTVVSSPPTASYPSLRRRRFLMPGLITLVVLLSLLSAHLYKKFHAAQTAAGVVQRETLQLVEEVGALMVLPDETPTVATVTDPDKLKEQAFFAGATKGDKVLIYTGARKAILYNPRTQKIINVAPINIDGDSAQ